MLLFTFKIVAVLIFLYFSLYLLYTVAFHISHFKLNYKLLLILKIFIRCYIFYELQYTMQNKLYKEVHEDAQNIVYVRIHVYTDGYRHMTSQQQTIWCAVRHAYSLRMNMALHTAGWKTLG
jgi:hypothetical protein